MSIPKCLRTAGRAAVFAVLLGAIPGVSLTGCSKPASNTLEPGSYRAVVQAGDGRSVPFEFDVALEERGPVLYLLNGAERVRATEVDTSPGKVAVRFAGFENGLTAKIANGRLEGTLTLVHPDDRTLELPFEATFGELWRFFPDRPNDNADMSGRWDITLTDDAGRSSRALADLRQRFGSVSGTVIGPADDQRYLAGEVRDDELRLSRFDGGALVLYEGKLDARGRWVGEAWSDRGGRQRFVAVRNPDATIDGSTVATQLRDPEAPFTFAFRDLAGNAVSSSDPRFAGKVLLVTLAGSWCPNSHDEASLLVQLDRRYRDRGLAVVGLMFEQHDDASRAAKAVERFRTAYGIQYDTLLAGPMDKTRASAALPQLDGVRAYPTTLFIDRNGSVRKVHTGFHGPATGPLHERMVGEFEATLEQLLSEGAPSPVPDRLSPGSS